MKLIFCLCIFFATCNNQPECPAPSFSSVGIKNVPNGVSAKRAVHKPATPVITDTIAWYAPDTAMGFIVAKNIQTGVVVWKKQVYKIINDPALEEDVQDVFIDSMVLKCNNLFIHNEKNEVYKLNLQNLSVSKL